MNRDYSLLVFLFAFSLIGTTAVAREAGAPPSYEETRQASWILTSELIKTLGEGDATQWPGTRAWLKDLREQTEGVGKEIPIAKWPKVDIGKLVDHNPNFWRMYYEIAPADPRLTLIHSGLLLSQGEAMRAAYILELGQHRPGIPKEGKRAMRALQGTAMAALKATNTMTEEGTRLFDRGDYDGALKKYREALKLCPQNGWTSYELGYTLRTQAAVARGEPLKEPDSVTVNEKSNDSPEVTAAFAESRCHDPLQFRAYQGTNPEVLKGLVAIVRKVTPAWKALREEAITKDAEYHALKDLSEGLLEAGVCDLAILARQLMAARRNGYDSSDYPIIAASLRKLAPGKETEEILARLGGKGPLGFRNLSKQEDEEGQPALGSGERLYMPDKPPAKTDANKPVNVDHIRFLTGEDELAARTTADNLTEFIKAFNKIADEVLGKSKTRCKVLVQFVCAPSGHAIKIMHQPKDVDGKLLKEMHDAIAKMDKLPVSDGTVEFQIQLTVTPKNKRPADDGQAASDHG
jgi:hypothetical protein